jgi:hypothetical protein
MARVSGPLLSLDASGKIGGTMVASKWKGRNYMRQLVIPKNPKSAGQLGVRAMMKFLSQAWAAIGAGTKDDYDELATQKAISAFNAFMGVNLSRWQNFFAPSQAYPAPEASTPLTVTTQTLTGGEGHATVEVTPSGSTSIWGIMIFRDTAEITAPSWSNCIAVIFTDDANKVTFVDSPLETDTYHYRTAVFNVDGILGTVHADGTAVVT